MFGEYTVNDCEIGVEETNDAQVFIQQVTGIAIRFVDGTQFVEESRELLQLVLFDPNQHLDRLSYMTVLR
jgi:hypothetical protein